MTRTMPLLLALAIGLGLGWWLHPPHGPLHAAPDHPLTIEKLRSLAGLAVLRVSIGDVQVQEISGYTGSARLILVVKGDVEIATDLAQARWVRIDPQQRTATLSLPRPAPNRPRLDHERTRIYLIQVDGLWELVPGEQAEAVLANRALQNAQRVVEQASQQPELIEQARRRTEEMVEQFCSALGWRVQVTWRDQPTAQTDAYTAPPSSEP